MTSIQGYFNISITSSASKLRCERRFPSNLTLSQLKEKLVLITGCDNKTMKIELFDKDERSKGFLSGDLRTLEELNIEEGSHIHVTDPTLEDGAFDKMEEPNELYQISAEEYAKRENTLLAWKRRNKLGQFREIDPEEAKKAEEERQKREEEERAKIESLSVGSRCEVRVPNQLSKRGVIEFIGTTKFKPGYWIGIRYDEPLGKNDGSVDGVRYFQCPEKYGTFVKPQYVEAGDFPELGIDELDEI